MNASGITARIRARAFGIASLVVRRASFVSRVYAAVWRVWLAVRGTSHSVTVGDAAAVFRTTTRSEYVRATSMGGERHVVRAFLDEVGEGDVVWDVGACIGTYACLAADHGAHVVAVEPEPANHSRLRENLARNTSTDRWTATPVALADRDGHARLRSDFQETGSGHHYLAPESLESVDTESQPASEANSTDRTLAVASGDTLVRRGIPSPDVIKMDVQGAEHVVIDGLSETLEDVRAVFVEVHSDKCRRYDCAAETVAPTLERLGFTVDRLDPPRTNRGGVRFLRAIRP